MDERRHNMDGALFVDQERRETPGERTRSYDDGKAEAARRATQGILDRMDLDASVHVREDDERIVLDIDGPDAGRAIGKKGMTLEALQFLVNKIINRDPDERRHIIIDSGDYRERHDNGLVSMAKREAKRAVSSGRAITLEPMSARDRRVIHVSLAKFPGVSTRSEGEGMERRLQIIPLRGERSRGERGREERARDERERGTRDERAPRDERTSRDERATRDERPRDERTPRDERAPRQERARDDRESAREDWARDERPRDDRAARDERPRDERPRDERPRDDRTARDNRTAREDRTARDERPRDERPRDERPRDERPRDERARNEQARERPNARDERGRAASTRDGGEVASRRERDASPRRQESGRELVRERDDQRPLAREDWRYEDDSASEDRE